LALGEFESQKALWQHIPDNVVVPIAHGTFRSDDSKSFFLASFHHLQEGKIPDAPELADLLKTLHTSAASPTGKFGFHVTTFNGYVPLVNDWCDTWEEWFSRQLRFDIEYEQSGRGADADFMAVVDEFFAKVIPRLLRPLETGGRSIQPTLIHGDLWHGNTGIINDSTNKVVLFDSCCCYAHHESTSFILGPLTEQENTTCRCSYD
jgi:fructosamine-3-kinase